MSRREHLRAVERAEHGLERECARWQSRTLALRERFRRHRTAWLLGGGVAAGFVAGLLPWRAGANLGRLAVSASTLVMRSPLGLSLWQSMQRRTAHDEAARAE